MHSIFFGCMFRGFGFKGLFYLCSISVYIFLAMLCKLRYSSIILSFIIVWFFYIDIGHNLLDTISRQRDKKGRFYSRSTQKKVPNNNFFGFDKHLIIIRITYYLIDLKRGFIVDVLFIISGRLLQQDVTKKLIFSSRDGMLIENRHRVIGCY